MARTSQKTGFELWLSTARTDKSTCLEGDMKAPWLLQLLGTLAMVPVFTISYVSHLHPTPASSHAENAWVVKSKTMFAEYKPNAAVALRTLTLMHPQRWDVEMTVTSLVNIESQR